MTQRALSGIRILDFGRALAGTYGTLLLADLGAEVIKIEQRPADVMARAKAYGTARAPLYGLKPSEETRNNPEDHRLRIRGESHYQSINRNKKRIAINLETGKGRETFHDLVRHADVVHDNFRPRMLKKIGIDFETLKQVNPKIISCSVSGYGEDGPWNDGPAYDAIIQALGGLMRVTGLPDSVPCVAGIAVCDLCSGMFGALGILSAVRRRDLTGEGQRVDISMLDSMISLFSYQIGIYSALGDLPAPRGSGLSGGGQIPYGAYRCKDDTYISLASGTPRHWSRFIQGLGATELETDPRFDSVEKREKSREVLTGIINEKLITRRAESWEAIFRELGIPAGVVNNLEGAINHPQVRHRNMVVPIEQPTGERWKFAANPIKIKGSSEVYRPAGAAGSDTVEVLTRVLGYSGEHIDALRHANAIWDAAWDGAGT